VIRRQPGGGEGTDFRSAFQSRTVPLDHAATRERRADHPPHAGVAGVLGVPHRGPVHHFVEAGDAEVVGKEFELLVEAIVAAAFFPRARRHRGAGLDEHLERRAGAPCLLPELGVLWPVDVGELMACLAGPGIAARQHQGRLEFRRQMGGFDVLVHFAEPRHRREIRVTDAAGDLAGIRPARPDEGDASAADDDLLILEPLARMDCQQPADFDGEIGRKLSERHQRQLLPDGHLVTGIEDQVVGHGHVTLRRW
jgi:hypothetical protein